MELGFFSVQLEPNGLKKKEKIVVSHINYISMGVTPVFYIFSFTLRVRKRAFFEIILLSFLIEFFSPCMTS